MRSQSVILSKILPESGTIDYDVYQDPYWSPVTLRRIMVHALEKAAV
jgi:hypothetical protein